MSESFSIQKGTKCPSERTQGEGMVSYGKSGRREGERTNFKQKTKGSKRKGGRRINPVIFPRGVSYNQHVFVRIRN